MTIRIRARPRRPRSSWRPPPRSRPPISDPVKTDAGQISGVTLPSGVRAFKGIPFGAPPVGDLRWREPQPVAKWTASARWTPSAAPACRTPRRTRATGQRRDRSSRLAEDERGLPLPERLDAGRSRQRPPAGDGLDLRRRLHRRRRQQPAQRRREPRQEGRGPRHLQLPPRRVRLLLAPGADEGIGPQRVGQPGAGRCHRRAARG